MNHSLLLDDITFRSKNLFNVATYTIRQRFFTEGKWIRYNELWYLLKDHEVYQHLQRMCGSHPPQQVLKQVDRNFKSFFKAIKIWNKTPSKFTAMPQLTHYKRKNGKNLVYFTSFQCRLKKGYVLLTQKMLTLGFPKISTDLASVKCVRIVPFGDRYNIELIFNFDPQDLHLTKAHILGMDLAKKQAKERAKKQAKERAFDQAIQEKDRIIQKLKTEIQRLKDA